MILGENVVHLAVGEHDFQRAIEEGDVAADGDWKPIVREVRAENRALEIGRHPITLHARLTIRIHKHNLYTKLLRFVKILRCDRLVVRRIRAEEYDEVRIRRTTNRSQQSIFTKRSNSAQRL